MFQNIPANIRVPLFYAEMDNSMAGTFQQNYRALLIGQSTKLNGIVDEPKLISSRGSLIEIVGEDSMLIGMFDLFRKNNISTELWVLPVKEDSLGVQAKGTITITGTATESGILSLYIAGKLVSTTILESDTNTEIIQKISESINSNKTLPVIATAVENSITLTCKWKGLTGNDIDLRTNYLGENNGEITPAGIELKIVSMTGGLLNPSIDIALSSLGDEAFDFIGLPFTDSASLKSMQEFMNDTTGRWSWEKQIYGHSFSVINKDVAEAQTFGSNLNDQHKTIVNLYKTPNPTWEVLGALLGQASNSLGIDPARPLQTLPLIGILSPNVKDLLDTTNRNTLLFNGIATINVVNGVSQIERLVTNYQKDKYGNPDNSYLDVQTLFTSAYTIRNMRQVILQKYGRHKLADDGTRFAEGQPIVTPKVIRAELIALYFNFEQQGLVENADIFAKNLIVERDVNDKNRVNVLFPSDYINQLRVLAVVNQFKI